MHDEQIDASVFTDFYINRYFNIDGKDYGYTHSGRIFYYDQSTGEHYEILSVTNEGNKFSRVIVKVDNKGNHIGKARRDSEVTINSIYDLDQFFGGAYVEELQENGTLDYSEVQNDIVYKIICDLGLKENFIGYCVNASTVKSGQRNNNDRSLFFDGNNEKLQWFEMSTRYGGAQMNADHNLSETEITEMSQMISALIQSGIRTRQVDKIYRFIGAVAKESLGDLVELLDDPNRELDVYR